MVELLSLPLPRFGSFRAAGKHDAEDTSENEFFDQEGSRQRESQSTDDHQKLQHRFHEAAPSSLRRTCDELKSSPMTLFTDLKRKGLTALVLCLCGDGVCGLTH